jgi:hypothetical protein
MKIKRNYTKEESELLAGITLKWSKIMLNAFHQDCGLDSKLGDLCMKKYKGKFIVCDLAFRAVGAAMGAYVGSQIARKEVSISEAERALFSAAIVGTQDGLEIGLALNDISNVIDITKYLKKE